MSAAQRPASASPARRGRLLFIVLLLGLLFSRIPNGAGAQSGALPVGDYWRLLDSVRQALQPAEISPEDRRALAERLEAVRRVELPDGTQIPIDPSYLAARLRAAAPDLESLRSTLDSILARRGSRRGGEISAADLTALAGILARSEFQWAEEAPNPIIEFFRRAFRWFLEQLSRIAPAAEPAGRLLRAAVTAGLGVLLAWILLSVYRGAMRTIIREAELDLKNGPLKHMTADQARQQARQLSNDGDFRSGVRYLYLSTLFALEEKGFVRTDRTRTNREVLADLAGREELADTLRGVIQVFDRVWYGFQPIDERDYILFSRSVEHLRSLHQGPS